MKKALPLILFLLIISTSLFAQVDGSVGIKFKPVSGDYNLIRSYQQEHEDLTFDTRYPLVFSVIRTGAFEFINHDGLLMMAIKGDDARVYFKGNIGVGTTSPNAQVDIEKTTSFNYPLLNLNYPWDKENVLQIKRGSSLMVKMGNGGGSYAHGVLNLFSSNESKIKLSGSPMVPSYFNAGNVGIGTSAPTEKLEVNGNIRTTGGDLYATLTNNDLQFNRSGSSYISNLSTGGALAFTIGGGSSHIRMFINGSGNVGIGTSSPGSFKLVHEQLSL